MVCLFTTLWQKFSCAVLTVCTVPMNARSLTASGRRHNKGVIRWNNILRNLANRNAGRMILMDIEHELRAMDQARLTTDGIHFDSIEGQYWLNRVFQERLDELEAELFFTGVLKEEGTVSDAVITTFVPPSLETRLGTVPAVTNYRQQSSSEPGRRTDVQHARRVGSRMDRVLLGKSLPESLALFDKGIPPSSSESIDSGINSLVRDIRSGEFRERTGDTAHGWNTEPATRWTSDIDRNNPRKLGRTNETGTLSRADERESEESGYEEIHGLVEQNKRPETHSYPVSLAAKPLWNRRRRDN